MNATLSRSGSRRAKPPFQRRRAGRREHAAPVRVVSEGGGLDERRGRDAARNGGRLGLAGRAGDIDLEQHGRALAVRHDLGREVGTDLSERGGEARVGRRVARHAARAVGEQDDRVVRRALAVDRDAIEALCDDGPQEALDLVPGEGEVGRDDGEHRGQAGMDHPGALRHAPDGEAVARDGGLLRARVGGEDGRRRVGTARRRERVRDALEPGQQLRHRQRDADHPGREDEHLVRHEPQELGRARGGRARVRLSLRAGSRVRAPRVDDDRLRLGRRQGRARNHHGRSLDTVGGEHRRTDGGRPGADERHVGRLTADARRDAAGEKAAGCSDAHERTSELPACRLIRAPRRAAGRACRRSRTRGSRSGSPGRLRPCRGCRSRR